MNGIELLGGITVKSARKVAVGDGAKSVAGMSVCREEKPIIAIEEKDFKAVFDGHHWVVTWLWSEGKEPNLKNATAEYEVPQHV